MLFFSPQEPLTLERFEALIEGEPLALGDDARARLDETRSFIDYLLEHRLTVYGLTTGFADLRNRAVPAEKVAELSRNIIESHDAGIGPSLDAKVVLGAMIVRANALAKGYSGFRSESLMTLIEMINARIIPDIPCHGSLGASGDLALLARLGRAMQGGDVSVCWRGRRMSAGDALREAGIRPFEPSAKEGLALTNGTSFMASMGALALLRQQRLLENVLGLLPLFLDAAGAVDSAFAAPIHEVRGQKGQTFAAALLSEAMKGSPWIDRTGVQDDYCIRCIPQILGPKLEMIAAAQEAIERELDAVTDNPLIFRRSELNDALDPARILRFRGEPWAVLSGGNFHGESLTAAADMAGLANAKIALLLERQMTYLLNPDRNRGKLPIYLIPEGQPAGLSSGYMITQYTGNDLAQKIAALGVPTGIYNLTSANESEDVVSYGSTACQRWLSQLGLLEDFLSIYLAILLQAYSLRCRSSCLEAACYSATLFAALEAASGMRHPYREEASFGKRYEAARRMLEGSLVRDAMGRPWRRYVRQYSNQMEGALV